MEEQAVALGFKFAELLGRNSVTTILDRKSIAKGKQDAQEQILIYEDIINQILQDKTDLEAIAREYKEMYEKVSISDEDIEHLQNTVQHVINLFAPPNNSQENRNPLNQLVAGNDVIADLINKDTLKTMQLLGFNYKEAIGQPLTEVCAETIRKKLTPAVKSQSNTKGKR